ncbi:response regulator, partial [Rhizobium ruizarguesonis]
ISWAASGQEALDMLGSMVPKPGLILLDLNMPGLDGRTTLEAIKSNAGWRKIPGGILTTSDDERDIDGCYALGARTSVQKPV